MSEHSRGNAIDVTKIVLNNGKNIMVRKPGFFAFREKGLLNSVRSDACGYFTTVLGPGYNPEHADHFHFDLMQRRSATAPANKPGAMPGLTMFILQAAPVSACRPHPEKP